MGETDNFRKRRTFCWSKEARGLVREYKARIGSSLGHNEADWRTLLIKLTETSGNLRDACLRFVRQFEIARKRSYREWTKYGNEYVSPMVPGCFVDCFGGSNKDGHCDCTPDRGGERAHHRT